jgi:hypothetical protein
MAHLLLVGPSAEHVHGSPKMLLVMFGRRHVGLCPHFVGICVYASTRRVGCGLCRDFAQFARGGRVGNNPAILSANGYQSCGYDCRRQPLDASVSKFWCLGNRRHSRHICEKFDGTMHRTRTMYRVQQQYQKRCNGAGGPELETQRNEYIDIVIQNDQGQ